jgi:hypothetical protein
MDREQAIAWLRSVGRIAHARDWVMGETIQLPVGEPEGTGDIQVYPGLLYLYPTPSGGWNLWNTGGPDPTAEFPDLETAVAAAHEYAVQMERALRER